MSTTTTPAPVTAPTESQTNVEHLYWVETADFARSMGLTEVQSICGQEWVSIDPADAPVMGAMREGRIVTDSPPEICRTCDALLRAAVAELALRKHGLIS